MLARDVYENFLKGRRRSQAVGSPVYTYACVFVQPSNPHSLDEFR